MAAEDGGACIHMKCPANGCGHDFCFRCLGPYPNCECLPEEERKDVMDMGHPLTMELLG